MLPPVLAMRPVFVEKPWGGARIASLPAKLRSGHTPPPSAAIGESWEVADLPEGSSTVDGGPLHGTSLRELVAEHGASVCGARAGRDATGAWQFPLLVKLIDAALDLSIQVHPDAAFARAHPGTFPKDEAWLVVECEPHARVLHGLKEGVDRDRFARAIHDGTPDALLREIPVRAGDVFRIRPGTFHAIGAGSLLLEVQQPSNTTFRVWDWGRSTREGQTRCMHVQEALDAGHFGAQDEPRVGAARRSLEDITAPGFVPPSVRTAHYHMSVHDVSPRAPMAVPRAAGEPAVVFALHGAVTLGCDHVEIALPRGATGLVCALAAAPTVRASSRATVVVLTTGGGS